MITSIVKPLLSTLLLIPLFIGCISSDSGYVNESCQHKQTLSLYSLDRENKDVLNSAVKHGELLVYNESGVLVHSQYFDPMPPSVTLDLPHGVYNLLITGNVSDNMNYNSPNSRSGANHYISHKAQDDEHHHHADSIHLGRLPNYTIGDATPDTLNSVHIKRMVGMVSVIINNVKQDSSQYYFNLIVSGTSSGINLHQELDSTSILIRKPGAIIDEKAQIDAVCFPSVDTLKVKIQLIDKQNESIVAEIEKSMIENLQRNKWIGLEYEFKQGEFIELGWVIKDWTNNQENETGPAN